MRRNSHSRRPSRRNGDASDLVDLERLRQIFDLPEFEDAINEEYCLEARSYAEREVMRELDEDYEDPTPEEIREVEEKAEEAGLKAEEECQSELYAKYCHAIFATAEQFFDHVGLDLQAVHRERIGRQSVETEWVVTPQRSWNKAADEIRETIGGTGIAYVPDTLEEWLDDEGWTAKEAVLGHLGSIGSRAAVYGLSSPSRVFERAFE